MTTDKSSAAPAKRPDHRAEVVPDRNRIRTLTSCDLFGRETEIGIEHEGALYRLRITRQGKLILNK